MNLIQKCIKTPFQNADPPSFRKCIISFFFKLQKLLSPAFHSQVLGRNSHKTLALHFKYFSCFTPWLSFPELKELRCWRVHRSRILSCKMLPGQIFGWLYNRVFQNFGKYGNQSFLGRTFRRDRRKTLRIAKKLRFLLWPGLQRRPGRGQFHWG